MIEDFLDQIHLGDCVEVMGRMPNESIDLILTDPPYNASNSKIVCEEKCN